MTETFSSREYLRDIKPPFCAGCGAYTVTNVFLRALHELGHEDLSKFVFCSGIGCSAWIPSPHFIADSIHTPHGRSITVATGVKLVKPEARVVVFGGDGDIVGIGMSHFVHAARRNLDILVIMVNNMVYGMTGGQVAPTTPFKTRTTTTPYGSFEDPLDAARLAVTAGACYVARWTTAHQNELKRSMKRALETKGFRFVEVLSQCPTAYGRKAGFRDAREILKAFKKNAVTIEHSERMTEKELLGKVTVGEFSRRSRPTLAENIYSIIDGAKRQHED